MAFLRCALRPLLRWLAFLALALTHRIWVPLDTPRKPFGQADKVRGWPRSNGRTVFLDSAVAAPPPDMVVGANVCTPPTAGGSRLVPPPESVVGSPPPT